MQSVVVLFVVCCDNSVVPVISFVLNVIVSLSVCKNEIFTRFHVVQDVLANLSGVSEWGFLMYRLHFSTFTW